MMKRPPGLWLLLSAGVLWLCSQDVSCVRATSLIFSKSTTTTTSTPDPSSETAANSTAVEDENGTVMDSTAANVTKLTGIPQVDYQYDPNLPRELNGFNLTEYPFYDRVPEEIDFKCDGLHDGFYASVAHQCQVYHHCLYGTRYDFLCANYTAFDQKTFICHFASEVDCVNSKNFWHRNDALYKATTTTTIKPLIVYTPPAPPAILTGGRPRPQAPSGGGQGSVLGGGARRRKPARRRRPQYDYYDEYDEADEEYYDDPRYTATEAPVRQEGRRRNKRPRPRPRPVYDDEYEEYEDERYDRRRGSSRRGRPTSRRNKEERRKYDDEYEEYEDEDPRFDRSEERRNKKPKDDRRKPMDDDRKRTDEERRTEKKPSEDRRFEEEDRRPSRPRKGSRRPIEDDYDEEERKLSKRKEDPPSGSGEDKSLVKPVGTSLYDRPRVAPKIRPPVPKKEADKYAYKTTPGPASTQASPLKATEEEYYDDEYEEEPPKKQIRPSAKDSQADASITSNSRNSQSKNRNNDRDRDRDRDDDRNDRRGRPKPRRPPVQDDYEYEEEEQKPRRAQKPKNEERRVGQGSRKRPATIEYEDDDEDVIKPRDNKTKDKPRNRERERERDRNRDRDTERDRQRDFDQDRQKDIEKESEVSSTQSSTTTRRKYPNKELFRAKTITSTTPSTTTTTTTTTTEAPRPKEESNSGNKAVRIVKRPFLPSRGGNPYIARGLQPIGLKSEAQRPQESQRQPQVTQSEIDEDGVQYEEEYRPVKQQRNNPQTDVVVEDYRPQPRPGFVNRGTVNFKTQSNQPVAERERGKVKEDKNPLDINENEYDVTLNDALNPTLPNLPLRQFPTGFGNNGNNVNNDYTFSAFHRPRFVVDATINSASSEYQYRYKQPQMVAVQQMQANAVPAAPQQVRQPESHQDFNYQPFRPSPRITHAQSPTQTQAFYSSY